MFKLSKSISPARFARQFSTSVRTSEALRIGYVPEHFSTPLHFAQKYFHLDASLVPFPAGTGHMVESLKQSEIDVGIGLTEGWVAALGKEKEKKPFSIVGTYVKSPLRWAISTGANSDIKDVSALKNTKVGVSRIGSGSYVMSFVLADQQGWLKNNGESPFQVVPLENFARLREGVNNGTADFFMWEHFTSKRYYDNGEIKKIGEIETPWSSWKIVARDATDKRMQRMSDAINNGIMYFKEHEAESVKYISTELDYSKEDAEEWMKTVDFPVEVRGVDPKVIEKTVQILSKAGVIDESVSSEDLIGIKRESRAAN